MATKSVDKEATAAKKAKAAATKAVKPAVTETADKVAVSTNNVPEGAIEPNADETVKVFDGLGNVVGSITEEAAEAAATVVQPEGVGADVVPDATVQPEETKTATEPEIKVEVVETYNDLRLNMTLRKGTVLTMPTGRAHELLSKILVKLI